MGDKKYPLVVFFLPGKIPNLAPDLKIIERIILISKKLSVFLLRFEPAIFKSSEYWET
jgi:hypothetical protein